MYFGMDETNAYIILLGEFRSKLSVEMWRLEDSIKMYIRK
jgi:hypothetical protein